ARAAAGAPTSEAFGRSGCCFSSSLPLARFCPTAPRAACYLQSQGARVRGLSSRSFAAKFRLLFAEMPGRRSRRNTQTNPTRVALPPDPEVECAIQFRRIGDKLNFRQKLLNLIAKLFRLGT
uniref:Phorbol-12-myristate-13-acetate-induced protein 1 n=1 Tax=Sus scrofa TaxID=9823 RepID=F1SMU1_PIG